MNGSGRNTWWVDCGSQMGGGGVSDRGVKGGKVWVRWRCPLDLDRVPVQGS